MRRQRIRPTKRSSRSAVAFTLLVAVVVGVAAHADAAAPCWRLPVVGTVVDPYREPACTWCPGNRAIEYQVDQGSEVRAVAAGTVTFSGAIAGERYLVVELASGWKLTYGRIESTSLSAGDAVVGGSIVARTTTRFLFGLRIDGDYEDPGPYLGAAVGRRRLIPTDGRSPRPAPPPVVRCTR